MNNVPELIKANPDAFDFPDCRPGNSADEWWANFHKQSNEHLPDYLKEAMAAAKAKRDAPAV